jgi:hypothetical protein
VEAKAAAGRCAEASVLLDRVDDELEARRLRGRKLAERSNDGV